jgi:hypothetical protein
MTDTKTPAEELSVQRASPVVQFASRILRPYYFNPHKLFRRRFYWGLAP